MWIRIRFFFKAQIRVFFRKVGPGSEFSLHIAQIQILKKLLKCYTKKIYNYKIKENQEQFSRSNPGPIFLNWQIWVLFFWTVGTVSVSFLKIGSEYCQSPPGSATLIPSTLFSIQVE